MSRWPGRFSKAIPAVPGGSAAASTLAVMMMLVPALGVPGEFLLQDSLKSMLAAFGVLTAALLFFGLPGQRARVLRWHALIWLPLMLMLYALGSMLWSHGYLGGVEAIRWFVFSLLLWLGMNTLTRERLPELAWAIHLGALFAAGWAALQFWIDLRYFPQGASPASTFVNRNFFAEYAVCTLPFSVWLLVQSRRAWPVFFLAISLSFTVVALLMTGTRSALVALWLLLVGVFPWLGFTLRRQLACSRWPVQRRFAVLGAVLATVVGLGLIPTGNPKITAELRGQNALERGILRSASLFSEGETAGTSSVAVRLALWKATGRMIAGRPLSGVGAGAWEVHAPLYQAAGSPLEADYYAHNEWLQLIAEYGLVGWGFLLGLAAYLARAAWATLKRRSAAARAEAPLRAMALCSLLALMVVSNAGFPWRLAGTGLMFALGLAILAASDTRLQLFSRRVTPEWRWRRGYFRAAGLGIGLLLVLATYISWQAVQAERKLVKAAQLALGISRAGQPGSPGWRDARLEMMQLVKEGIAINPHYRKLTPVVADELAAWGDWADAVWIWESVAASRPYVVGLLTNIGRGYAELGQTDRALESLARARRIQPSAVPVRSLELLLLSRSGQTGPAAALARQYLAEGSYDFSMLNMVWALGLQSADDDLAIQAMTLRNAHWPIGRVGGYLKLGALYAGRKKDEASALAAYRAALAAADPGIRPAVRQQIPPAFLARL